MECDRNKLLNFHLLTDHKFIIQVKNSWEAKQISSIPSTKFKINWQVVKSLQLHLPTTIKHEI